MILIVQTPMIPRTELHKDSVFKMMKIIKEATSDLFSEVFWVVNLDAITGKVKNHTWENVEKTSESVLQFSSENSIPIDLNISHNPCFYLAFKSITERTFDKIEELNLTESDYCTMWLEDDWLFTNETLFRKNLEAFLSNDQIKIMTLHKNKINMGGNPDVIKGEIFEKFKEVNLSPDLKRDPENIRKYDVWAPHIYDQSKKKSQKAIHEELIKINPNANHPRRKDYDSILSSDVVQGQIGDSWRSKRGIMKNWTTAEKSGIPSEKSFTYKA